MRDIQGNSGKGTHKNLKDRHHEGFPNDLDVFSTSRDTRKEEGREIDGEKATKCKIEVKQMKNGNGPDVWSEKRANCRENNRPQKTGKYSVVRLGFEDASRNRRPQFLGINPRECFDNDSPYNPMVSGLKSVRNFRH